MAADRDELMSASNTPPEDVIRTTRPRVTGILAIVLAVILVLVAVAWFLVGAPAVGPAVACLLLAVVSVVIGGLSLRVAAGRRDTLPSTGPLTLLTILAFAIGFVGAGLGIVLGAIGSSPGAIGAGVTTFILGILVAVQGVLVYGAAKKRAA
ncbi:MULTISPECIES: hypothetical protein [unclassified Microbacterium]|uniref:hypothetical protein n=1 Tax=unclassified Microbacterium TaxID=2609290 RepID=UPI00115FF542|nr:MULTISPECIES: hypothetical protein [unclassified Microbacterium]